MVQDRYTGDTIGTDARGLIVGDTVGGTGSNL